MKRSPALQWVFAVCAAALLLSCGTGSEIAGGSSGTPNGTISARVTYCDGTAAPGIRVRIRPDDYLPDSVLPFHAVRNLLSDRNGRVSADSLDTGEYRIECTDTLTLVAFQRATIRTDNPRIDLGDVVLEPGFPVKVILRGPGGEPVAGFVRVMGFERLSNADTSGLCVLPLMESGTYILVASPASEAYAAIVDTITVTSDSDSVVIRFPAKRLSRIRVNTTSSGALISEPLPGFPLLVRLDSANFDFSGSESDGSDVRFLTQGQDLHHEIEQWDPVLQRAVIWVRLDTLRPDTFTTIDLVYGSAPPNGIRSSQTVFDTARGFSGVWHLSESGTTAYRDATGFGRDGISSVSDGDKSGIIGAGQRFSGRDHIEVMPQFMPMGPFTIEAWFRVDSLVEAVTKIAGTFLDSVGYTRGWQVKLRKFDLNFNAGDGTARKTAAVWQVVEPMKWYHYAAVYTPGTGTVSLFLNGVERVLNDAATAPSIVYPIPPRTYISDPELPFKGILDEVRFSSTARSAAWIRACFENQREDQKMVVVE